jgi:hypothetical protein
VKIIVNPVFVRLRGTSKIYGFRDNFYSFNGNKPKPILRAEYEGDAKLLFRILFHRSHDTNQQMFPKENLINSKHSKRHSKTSSEACQC